MSGRPWTMAGAVRRAIVAHAREESPRECCGLLLGRQRHVAFAYRMTNVARGTTRFRVPDSDHIALRRVLRQFHPPVSILGVYHSHPLGAAWPSETDVAEAHYPAWVHLIVGLAPRLSIRAFRIDGDDVERVPLRLVSSRVGAR